MSAYSRSMSQHTPERDQDQEPEQSEDFAADREPEREPEEGQLSESPSVSGDPTTPAGGADSVPETPGDNNEERPVDYGGSDPV